MARIYAGEVVKTKVKVNLLPPAGITANRLRASGFPTENRGHMKRPEDVTDAFVTLAAAGGATNREMLTI